MKQQTDAAQVRAEQRTAWGAVAVTWGANPATPLELDPLTERLLALARIEEGHRVLDLACGAGNPSLFIAARIGPRGAVLGLDQVPAMVEGARLRAAHLGLAQAAYRVIASETELGVPAASFDAATCRHGMMYMPDPAAAVRALCAALRPGGRVAISSWAGLDRCPAQRLPLEIIERHVTLSPEARMELARPSSTLPTPEALEAVLAGAGLAEVESARVPTVRKGPNATAYWRDQEERSPVVSRVLAGLAEEVRQDIQADAIATLTAMFADGPVEVPGEALVAAGTWRG